MTDLKTLQMCALLIFCMKFDKNHKSILNQIKKKKKEDEEDFFLYLYL